MKKLENVDPTYADLRVAEADAAIASHREEIKRLEERKKLFVPHVSKKRG